MKTIALLLTLLTGGALLYVSLDFPAWGDPHSPASEHLSPYFIEHTMDDTSVPNIVTAVLADYRSFDTMFETAVVFTAAMACFLLLRLRRTREEQNYALFRHQETGIVLRFENTESLPDGSGEFRRIDRSWIPYDIITSTVARLIIPFIQLYALYVIAHGHHSPGGGFQGGVVLGAALILLGLTFDLRELINRISEKAAGVLVTSGVLLFAGVGALCMIYGDNFLDYGALAPLLGVTPVFARSLSILIVEVGVAMTVMATMVMIYKYVSSGGGCEEGL